MLKDVVAADLTSARTTLTHFRIHVPFRSHADTEESMKALQAVNDIMDGSDLDVTAYGRLFPLYSMFVRISSLMISSLLTALGVALGLGRIVASEIEAPNMLVSMV
jgi:hypothetical protein